MSEQFLRTEMLLGSAAIEKLRNARVAVFGLGGVGGYAVEALARSGVGSLDLIDITDEDGGQEAFLFKSCSRLKYACIVAFGVDDLAGIILQNFNEIFKHFKISSIFASCANIAI